MGGAVKRDQFEEHLAELMGSGITYAKMKSEDAVRAEYIRLTEELALAREVIKLASVYSVDDEHDYAHIERITRSYLEAKHE